MDSGNVKKKIQKNTEKKNYPKKQKLKTEESLDNFVDRKGDNFAVTKNGDPMYVFQIDGF